ncbi:MAG: hypothetical protein EP343_09920 [Deltaproteobacteria bacterium]|nr:MAG: hypothetical protein EP343_09920 [Deltaproteobacteria bacterium]
MYDPDITWTGNEWAVVWGDSRDGNREIYLARLSRSGVKLPHGTHDTRLTFNDYSDEFPRISWTGRELAVAWDSEDGVFLLRMQPNGTARTLKVSQQPGFKHFAYSGQALGSCASPVSLKTQLIKL